MYCFVEVSFILLNGLAAGLAAADKPSLQLLTIKTPQLIGILAGFFVFIATVGTVIMLLYLSGSFSKLMEEMKNTNSDKKGKKLNLFPQLSQQPELYEHLLQASISLSLKPKEIQLNGKNVTLELFDPVKHRNELIRASNGTAIYHESDYDCARIWGWLDSDINNKKGINFLVPGSDEYFDGFYLNDIEDGWHIAIIDKEMEKPVGMVSLFNNDPRNLNIRIGNIWLTPAFQGLKRAHDTVLTLLTSFISQGYRRITFEIDERHIIGRKFLEKCGFQLEAILRKHKIVQNRNRNTALYVILNTEWPEVEIKLKKLLGLSLKKVTHKVAEIDKFVHKTESEKKKNNKKKNKRNKKMGFTKH